MIGAIEDGVGMPHISALKSQCYIHVSSGARVISKQLLNLSVRHHWHWFDIIWKSTSAHVYAPQPICKRLSYKITSHKNAVDVAQQTRDTQVVS